VSRVQLALDVDDLEASVAFYTRLLGVGPAKHKPGYANFAVAEPPLKLVLLENPGRGGGLNHLGVEVEDTDRVRAETARLTEAGLLTDEETGATCCWATQDKVWATGPDGERWEVYAVVADAEVFGTPSLGSMPMPTSTSTSPGAGAGAGQPGSEPAASPRCC
jgi:catechol 2,3-dioxygenase-like lactoylglutathione lyase family enzyme